MNTTDPKPAPQVAPLLVPDHQLAPVINVSVGFLQKDRRTAQRIPFIRIGDRCLYDVQEVLQALKASTIGGARGRRGRRSSSVEGA